MECPNCQAQIPDGSKFCYDCGSKMNNPESSVASNPEDKNEHVLEVVGPHIFEGWAIEPQAKRGNSVGKVFVAFLLIVLGTSGVYLYHA